MDSEIIKESMAVNGDGKKWLKRCKICGDKFVTYNNGEHGKSWCHPEE